MGRTGKRSESDMELMKMLDHYQSGGVDIFFQDHLSTPLEVVTMMTMHEDEVFMPDYVMDKQDKLIQIRFDQVF